MKRLKIITIVVAIALVLSPLTITSTMAEGPLFKIQLLGDSTSKTELLSYGANIVEEYNDFIICNIDPWIIPQLVEKGYGVLPFELFWEIRINKYTYNLLHTKSVIRNYHTTHNNLIIYNAVGLKFLNIVQLVFC